MSRQQSSEQFDGQNDLRFPKGQKISPQEQIFQQTPRSQFVILQQMQEESPIQPQKSKQDFKKNICGYITKAVINNYLDEKTFGKIIRSFCLKVCKCDLHPCLCYEKSKPELENIKKKITGPSHVKKLFNQQSLDYKFNRQLFTMFYKWFLQERYLRFLINQSKTRHKSQYIAFKNNVLLPIINSCTKSQCSSQSSL